MTKEAYISTLKRQLKSLPAFDRQEILEDYEEHFRIGTEEGKSEETISEALGNPVQVGKAFIAESYLDIADKKEKPVRNVLRAVFTAMSLSFLNLIIGIPIIAAVVGVFVSLWAAALSCVVGGFASIIYTAVLYNQNAAQIIFFIFSGIGVMSFGGLFGLGMYYASKGFINLMKRYIRMTITIIINKEK